MCVRLSDNPELLEAEEIAAIRTAEAAEARVRILRIRVSSSRNSARSSASRSSRRTASEVADAAAGPLRISAPPRIPEEIIEVNIGTAELPIAVPRANHFLSPEVQEIAEYYHAEKTSATYSGPAPSGVHQCIRINKSRPETDQLRPRIFKMA